MGKYLLSSKYYLALADSYQKIGNFKKSKQMLIKLDEMEKQSFDEGKTYLVKARICIQTNQLLDAHEHLKNAKNIYQQRSDNRMLSHTYLEYANLSIQENKLSDSIQYIQMVKAYSRKVRGFNMYYLPECMELSINKGSTESDIDLYYKHLTDSDEMYGNYLQWYYISCAYKKYGNQDKAKNCRKTSQKLLIQLSEQNTNKNDAESMINNILIHQNILQ